MLERLNHVAHNQSLPYLNKTLNLQRQDACWCRQSCGQTSRATKITAAVGKQKFAALQASQHWSVSFTNVPPMVDPIVTNVSQEIAFYHFRHDAG